MMARKRIIAVVGLGAMGLPIALRLIDAGFDVRGVDRDEAARHRFAQAGGGLAPDILHAVDDADALLLLVVNSAQADEILFGARGVASGLKPGAVVIVSITAAPAQSAALGERLAEHGVLMVDCPVSGGVGRAAKGTLSVIASGPKAAIAAAEPFLAAMGRIYQIGDRHGQASTVKLLNQLLCGVHVAATAETIALAERLGVDSRLAYEVIAASSGTSWMFVDRAPAMLEDDGRTTAAVSILLKDLDLVAELGGASRARLPLALAARTLFREATAAGKGADNDSRIVDLYRTRQDG